MRGDGHRAIGRPRKGELVASTRGSRRGLGAPGSDALEPGNHSVRYQDGCYIRCGDGTEALYDKRTDSKEWIYLAGAPDQEVVKAEHAKGLPLVNLPDVNEDEITSLKTRRE